MQIKSWMESRQKPGTLADVARRVLESDRKYKDVEKTLQIMYVLEALIKHDGHQQKAADAIGVSRETVKRVVRSINMTAADVRRLARHFQRSLDADA